MDIKHEPHDYQPILSTLRMTTLESRREYASVKFLNNTVFGFVEILTLIARTGFRYWVQEPRRGII